MSIITYLELVYGAWNSQGAEANLAIIDQLRLIVAVQPLDVAMATHYGRLRTELERKGRRIRGYDRLIAAHALSLGLTLVRYAYLPVWNLNYAPKSAVRPQQECDQRFGCTSVRAESSLIVPY